MPANGTSPTRPAVSVIIPARNEELNLATCLDSLITQTGVTLEIIVVDDDSTDRTREIAYSFSDRVRVIEAPELPQCWTGKNNAVTAGARSAQGEWLLFTDADTVHLPGSLARALAEAREHQADMLSYSPEQIAVTFWEMAVLPVVFAELARQYPPSKVRDPRSSIAAANGQYIFISREAYDAAGGHAAVAGEILEDVALARAVKRCGRNIFFRYAADAVRTRMYRNFAQLREGWTKNLALLFPHTSRLAGITLFWWALPWVFGGFFVATHHWWWMALGVLVVARNTGVLGRANFNLAMEIRGALFGMPMFAYLLSRSRRAHRTGKVGWKGRTYSNFASSGGFEASHSNGPNSLSFRAQRGI